MALCIQVWKTGSGMFLEMEEYEYNLWQRILLAATYATVCLSALHLSVCFGRVAGRCPRQHSWPQQLKRKIKILSIISIHQICLAGPDVCWRRICSNPYIHHRTSFYCKEILYMLLLQSCTLFSSSSRLSCLCWKVYFCVFIWMFFTEYVARTCLTLSSTSIV